MGAVTASQTVGGRLGAFAADLSIERIPDNVVDKVRANLLHNLSCALGAHSAGPAVWAPVRDRRPEEATLLCDGGRIATEHAAFANAALMHTRAQDDTHFAAKTHVGSAVM